MSSPDVAAQVVTSPRAWVIADPPVVNVEERVEGVVRGRRTRTEDALVERLQPDVVGGAIEPGSSLPRSCRSAATCISLLRAGVPVRAVRTSGGVRVGAWGAAARTAETDVDLAHVRGPSRRARA